MRVEREMKRQRRREAVEGENMLVNGDNRIRRGLMRGLSIGG